MNLFNVKANTFAPNIDGLRLVRRYVTRVALPTTEYTPPAPLTVGRHSRNRMGKKKKKKIVLGLQFNSIDEQLSIPLTRALGNRFFTYPIISHHSSSHHRIKGTYLDETTTNAIIRLRVIKARIIGSVKSYST